ncbi:MAG: tRNA pseudouridine(38-40) synthase TruA [Bacteroidales bacterium]|nr:tRNA pseudouridine(38-40) synthase TruA [Lentimicrobiaceae bacterium]MDD5693848.1 tRNA pseudouridine(38-40) synthase TruA [Bacteroidales bacterium]
MESIPFRYFLQLSFTGKNYHGWQIQQNAPSVQATLESALSVMFNSEIRLVGCGRTDSGVHARMFYAHFESGYLTLEQRVKLVYQLNGYLPADIAVQNVFLVRPHAHARFDAVSRTYVYQISRRKDPFLVDLAHYVYGRLDVEVMNTGATELMNYRDFTSFSKLHTQVKTNYCKIMDARWTEEGDLLLFTITADRFLRNMVRAIVGTMLELGQHKITLAEFHQIIECRNRSSAGMSVPAHGLYLMDVQYPEDIFMSWLV